GLAAVPRQVTNTVQRSKSLPFSMMLTSLATCFCSLAISTMRPGWYQPDGRITVDERGCAEVGRSRGDCPRDAGQQANADRQCTAFLDAQPLHETETERIA